MLIRIGICCRDQRPHLQWSVGRSESRVQPIQDPVGRRTLLVGQHMPPAQSVHTRLQERGLPLGDATFVIIDLTDQIAVGGKLLLDVCIRHEEHFVRSGARTVLTSSASGRSV